VTEHAGPGRAPFPFIVGCGRSGTTLLRAMVDAHPDVAVPPESHFVVALAGDLPFDRRAFLDGLGASDRFALWGLDRTTVDAKLARSGAASYPDAVRALYAAYAAGAGKRRWADKTPGNVLHIARLAELFPEAVFVHLIRDGRDVAASFLELGWAGTIEEAAMHWKLRVRRGRRAGASLPAGRYHEVRYEALVADPEPSLRRFCRAAALAFEVAMLDHHARAAQVVRTTSHPSYHRHVAGPVRSDVRDWRRDLDTDDVARFDLVAGDMLAELGYERTASRPPARLRVDVARRRAHWYAHRLARKVTQQRTTTHKGVL
jgi:Sulfotransferase family